MATYTKFQQFVEDKNHGVHNMSSDTLKIALCASANAPTATDAILSSLTEIAYTNISEARTLVTASSAQSGGTYKLILADATVTASGGAVSPFRYVVIYNDTPVSPNDPLIAWYDYGSELTLSDGESLSIDFSQANGFYTDA
jgi:hypothetical protein